MVRFKNRYITFGIDNGKDITQPLELTSSDFYNVLIEVITTVHGDVGCSAIKPGLNVKYCNELTKVGIIRTRHGPHKIILSVLPLIKEIKNTSVTVNLLYVGATLLKCYKVLLNFQQSQIDKVNLKLQSSENTKHFISKLLSLKSLKDEAETLKKKPKK